jgi:hypothetical protein
MRAGLALAAAAFSLAVNAAGPVAFVADLQGNASIEGDGKVGFLAELNAGTRLLLGSGSTVAVTYAASGAEYTLRGPGEFVVSEAEVKADKGAAPTKRQVSSLKDTSAVARVSKTATASVRMRSVTASAARNALDYPVDTKIATLQPELRWTQVSGDAAEVKLLDANGKELWKGSAQAGAARPAMKLNAATRYRWTVMTAAGAVGEAQFETLPAEALMKVAKSKSAAKGFSERVMHAIVLQDLGATQEARAAWGELARERPELPELAALARQ